MTFREYDVYGAWALDVIVLIGASDVIEVLAWVETNRAGRRAGVFAERGDEEIKSFDEPRGRNFCGRSVPTRTLRRNERRP
ncbi:hypothetical protein [Sediminivirga luteola]|uniref:hypothetical protein n=1 Tax=Sediminivirga luteola TaxID=1774748 RepID=UPI001F5ABA22|nr:hypothetical protein [Sediminivirga luteola]MCI2266672.1 hypothetical protein [Sediminivirga luteola]